MAKFYSELNDTLTEFITQQKIFFVATAPQKGRINLSPKGMDTLRCLDNKTVAYLDVTGSGNETAAHLIENGRITMMFCSFSQKPLTLRLYGRGRIIRRRDGEWPKLYSLFEPLPGSRQIILLEIDSVQTSCGHGVPMYEFKAERDLLPRSAEKRGEEGIKAYQRQHNQVSIDGLPTKLLSD
jgi:hypothetical protein